MAEILKNAFLTGLCSKDDKIESMFPNDKGSSKPCTGIPKKLYPWKNQNEIPASSHLSGPENISLWSWINVIPKVSVCRQLEEEKGKTLWKKVTSFNFLNNFSNKLSIRKSNISRHRGSKTPQTRSINNKQEKQSSRFWIGQIWT